MHQSIRYKDAKIELLKNALASLLKRCQRPVNQNPYGIPEYKAGLLALCEVTGHVTKDFAWMDVLESLDK